MEWISYKESLPFKDAKSSKTMKCEEFEITYLDEDSQRKVSTAHYQNYATCGWFDSGEEHSYPFPFKIIAWRNLREPYQEEI